MKLEATCKQCKEDFFIKSTSISRFDFENERGRYFEESCPNCSKKSEYHVNDVTASGSAVGPAIYIVLALSILFTLILYFSNTGYISFIVLIVPLFVYFRLKQSNEKEINLFNDHKVSKTR